MIGLSDSSAPELVPLAKSMEAGSADQAGRPRCEEPVPDPVIESQPKPFTAAWLDSATRHSLASYLEAERERGEGPFGGGTEWAVYDAAKGGLLSMEERKVILALLRQGCVPMARAVLGAALERKRATLNAQGMLIDRVLADFDEATSKSTHQHAEET